MIVKYSSTKTRSVYDKVSFEKYTTLVLTTKIFKKSATMPVVFSVYFFLNLPLRLVIGDIKHTQTIDIE